MKPVHPLHDLVVYKLLDHDTKRVFYVGCGTVSRAKFWELPSRWKAFTPKKPIVKIVAHNLSLEAAHALETKLIKRYKPKLINKSFGLTTTGLPAWNRGLIGDSRCRGGRPLGIPMGDEAKRKLSEGMKGRARKWMLGRVPWNKGLTKEDHPSLRRTSERMKGNSRGIIRTAS